MAKVIGRGNNPNLNGTDEDDIMVGHRTDDRMDGRGGNDTMYGGHGNDALGGGDGNDILDGGGSADPMTGGAGSDTFVLRWYEDHDVFNFEELPAVDTITDFEAGDFIQVADYPVASWDVTEIQPGEYAVTFHTIEGDPRWDVDVMVLGVQPTEENFIFV